MNTSTSAAYTVNATESPPGWSIPLIVIAFFLLFVLVAWVVLRVALYYSPPPYDSERAESSSSRGAWTHPPPVYSPYPPLPAYSGPKPHRPQTAQSSCAESSASSNLHNS
ncbi:hypothetical protein EDD17DRAFT_1876350 [Pisolithus thermaeus]|nr:hypothetical protein EDD17DRAFT_1876350 [Pisolithus thermaeus]